MRRHEPAIFSARVKTSLVLSDSFARSSSSLERSNRDQGGVLPSRKLASRSSAVRKAFSGSMLLLVARNQPRSSSQVGTGPESVSLVFPSTRVSKSWMASEYKSKPPDSKPNRVGAAASRCRGASKKPILASGFCCRWPRAFPVLALNPETRDKSAGVNPVVPLKANWLEASKRVVGSVMNPGAYRVAVERSSRPPLSVIETDTMFRTPSRTPGARNQKESVQPSPSESSR